jgi:glycerol-1-phosphate dehydrogenase [NAD(P)+]
MSSGTPPFTGLPTPQRSDGARLDGAPSFQLLDDTLRREGVLDNALLASSVPWQAFVGCEQELRQAVVAFLRKCGFGSCEPSSLSFLVFVDGVPKPCGVSSADVVVRYVFDGVGVRNDWVNVADILGVPSAEVHASVEAIPKVAKALQGSKAQVVVVLGSGSLTDIVKHALHESKDERPFLVLPTALTVTAFTSAFAVLEDAGAKRTRVSRIVTGCVWYAPVLAQAPAAMSRAGFGDLLARFVAYGDWYLSHELGMAENYDERAYRLMEPFAPLLRAAAPDFAKCPQSLQTTEMVGAALSMAGIAMSVSGETTPLSGYEHVVSHALDFLRLTSKRPLVLHGEQVALASLSSAVSFDWLVAQETFEPERFRTLPANRVQRVVRGFIEQAPLFGEGELTLGENDRKNMLHALEADLAHAVDHFSKEYLKKHEKWLAFQEQWPAFLLRWPSVRARVRAFTLPASEMEALLVAAKLPCIPEETSPTTTAMEYRWALRFSPFVRSRMCLGDFLFWIGEDPALVAAV